MGRPVEVRHVETLHPQRICLNMFILKSHNQAIPNNYVFTQTTGIYHVFAANPIITEVAKAVSAFRIANRLPRASLPESLEDVDQFNCAVRKNDDRYCWDCAEPYARIHDSHPFFRKSCVGCGLVIEP